MRTLIFAALMTMLTQAAHAAAPSATSLTAGTTFEEYAGSATVGIGAVDTDSTLFYIDEKTVGGLESWFIFSDAATPSRVAATLQFDQPIVAVYTTRAGLDATTPIYGADSVSYGSIPFSGLEGADTLTWAAGSKTLTLEWGVIDPGDHIRVITAVPEPGTLALLTAGMLAVGWLARRRIG